MIVDRVARERAENQMLFQAVHEVARDHAGGAVDDVVAALLRNLPPAPRLSGDEVRRIAEQISVGRDPSGL
ncbi:hypothetical protein FDA94_06095 [Herbidospora galbida]|uniref:Uncharacterized protein n=1 Tax=Herbidospora galbida TaxID=2575442 RepID=A0A4U3MNU7_9ACTN|nr:MULTISPECIES: hypothetical protein [Herbidospora]TKK90559.1 hypothetical protein FDA94_06095 [Herbidospora galbida]